MKKALFFSCFLISLVAISGCVVEPVEPEAVQFAKSRFPEEFSGCVLGEDIRIVSNSKLLPEFYEKENLVFFTCGFDKKIYILDTGPEILIDFSDGSGDCPSGCIRWDHRFYRYMKQGKELVLVKDTSKIFTEYGAFKQCEFDSDCVEVKQGCCDCLNGGIQDSINKNSKVDYDSIIERNCSQVDCLAFVNCRPGNAACVSGKCEFVEKSMADEVIGIKELQGKVSHRDWSKTLESYCSQGSDYFALETPDQNIVLKYSADLANYGGLDVEISATELRRTIPCTPGLQCPITSDMSQGSTDFTCTLYEVNEISPIG